MFRPFTASLLAGLALAGCSTTPQSAAPPSAFIGTVSAADPRAEEAGMAMLRAGGSATDAAIATMLALNVVEPQSSGMGGGGFMVRGTAEGAVETFDGRESAPAGATPQWFLGRDGSLPPFGESVASGLSVGVPGNIALAAMAHAEHGKLPWAKLFEPALALARDGFQITPRLRDSLANMPEHAGRSEAARRLYFGADGSALPAGTLVRNSELAETLTLIANEGREAFYAGPLATEIATTVAADTPREGAMTRADVATYVAKERPPVCGEYRGYRICSMGPPTSGGVVVLQILGQIERFDIAALGLQNPVTWHLFAESQRLAYADREIYLADSDYVPVPVEGLIDPKYIASRSALISPDSTMTTVTAGIPPGASAALADGDEPEEHGTSHFAVVDADQTMVSYTSTIEGPFGSGLMAGGFYLNNELTDFSRLPVVGGRLVANRVEGGKRPRSSMSPTIVYDPQGRPFFVIGAAGGSTIPVQTARSIVGVIDFGLSAPEALGMPFLMVHGDTLMVEQGTWLEAAIPAFKKLGHIKIAPRKASVKANAVKREASGWVPGRDPRVVPGTVMP